MLIARSSVCATLCFVFAALAANVANATTAAHITFGSPAQATPTTGYTYDGTGNLTAIADSSDASFSRTLGYDGIGRLTSATGPWGSGTVAYDGVGNITSSAYGASALTYSYDSNNRLATLTGTGGARSAAYTYGNYGTIVSDGAAGNVNTNTYQYDGVPNLTCVNCADTNKKIEYVYDGNHSRVAVKKNSVNPNGSSTPLTTATYEFHSARGQLLLEYTPSENEQTTEHIYLGDKRIAQRSFNTRTANATTCVFDVSGDNSLSAEVDGLLITRYALGFRGANLIAGITTSPALNAGTIEARLLTLTTVAAGSPVGTKPILDLDGDGNVLGNTDALMIHRYLKGGSASVGDALTSKAINPSGTRNTTTLIQPYIATVCEKNPVPAGESISYFHNDIGGTPQAATDSAGNVLWKESYKPYGERINNAIATQGGKGNNEIYFHGKKAETQLNGGVTLQYFGARYYDPSGARFMSIDPVGFKAPNVHSFNRYAFANNNPYRYTDPDGKQAVGVGWIEFDPSQYLKDVYTQIGITVGSIVVPEVIVGRIAGKVSAAASAEGVSAAETTSLYRAVNQAERLQIATTKTFEAGNNSLGGKWFAESAKDASVWGSKMNGQGNSTIVEATLSRAQADKLMRVERLDGIGPARYGELNQLSGAVIKELIR
jgi:RHS repeat-associated protein